MTSDIFLALAVIWIFYTAWTLHEIRTVIRHLVEITLNVQIEKLDQIAASSMEIKEILGYQWLEKEK